MLVECGVCPVIGGGSHALFMIVCLLFSLLRMINGLVVALASYTAGVQIVVVFYCLALNVGITG